MSGLFSLGCGCKDSKAVSVSVSASDASDRSQRRPRDAPSSADTLTLTTASSSSPWDEESASTPSFSGLLRQLGELEQSVRAVGRSRSSSAMDEGKRGRRRHRRSTSEEGGGRVAESVAVVKETDDPLADFRRSMLQMIVENEIVGGDELRELLQRFLSLNSPQHHDLILRAFAEIWDEVFSGYEETPDLLRPPLPRHRH